MRLYLVGLIFCVITVLTFIIGLNKDPKKIPSNLINTTVPDFKLDYIGNGIDNFNKTDLLEIDDVKIVNVFASWCPPCKIEHSQISKLSEQHFIFGINQKDKKNDLLNWLSKLGNPYQAIGSDTKGRASINWGVYGIPETFILDKHSKIRYKHVGPIMQRDLEEIKNIISVLENED